MDQKLTRSEIKALIKELNIEDFSLYETDPNPQIRNIAAHWLRSSLNEQRLKVKSAQREFRRTCYNVRYFLQTRHMVVPVPSCVYVKDQLKYCFDHQSLAEAIKVQYGLDILGSHVILVDDSRMGHTLVDLFTPLKYVPFEPYPYYLARIYIGCGLIAELKYSLVSIGEIDVESTHTYG